MIPSLFFSYFTAAKIFHKSLTNSTLVYFHFHGCAWRLFVLRTVAVMNYSNIMVFAFAVSALKISIGTSLQLVFKHKSLAYDRTHRMNIFKVCLLLKNY